MPNGPVHHSLQTPKESTSKKFLCPVCCKHFTNKSNLNKHLRIYHEVVTNVTKPNVMNFECDLCPTFFSNRNQLLSHYENVHDKKLKEFIDFQSHNDFSNWKDMLEKERGAFFRMDGLKKSKYMKTFYYVCHRSYRKENVNKNNTTRLTKSQGSKISSKYCNCYLIARQNLCNNEIYVEYCLQHSHHFLEKCHLPISNLRKKEIVSKLDQGVPVNKIVDSIRSQAQPELHRDDLVTKKDVRNIKHAFKVKDLEYDSNDLKSVKLMFKSLEEKGHENPILFCKFENEDSLEPCLKNDDCLIIIQSGFKIIHESFGK